MRKQNKIVAGGGGGVREGVKDRFSEKWAFDLRLE